MSNNHDEIIISGEAADEWQRRPVGFSLFLSPSLVVGLSPAGMELEWNVWWPTACAPAII